MCAAGWPSAATVTDTDGTTVDTSEFFPTPDQADEAGEDSDEADNEAEDATDEKADAPGAEQPQEASDDAAK
jgi:hypothetical protein